ncbi:MAG: threonine ammonia-lyase, biosynthetic [Immundisolibacterales bacterium]|nr:threonine ammonia-lyase, biosynthetic [Immundisolibacterales bacterium]
MSTGYLERVLKSRVYEIVGETPLSEMPLLSERLGSRVLLKREDTQPVFSFKVRGAYNRMVRLDEADAARGGVAASAGNHAQGVALAARRLGIGAVIVMPETTPAIKMDAVRRLGAEVVAHGFSFDEANTHAHAVSSRTGRVYVHPFDDPDVIAGQGTVGMEILRQVPKTPRGIFVPVGGGGLIAGVAAYVKPLWPEVKIIGVEPEESASMFAALRAGRPVRLDEVGLFADGVAVRQVGEESFRLARQYVDEVVLVTTDETCAAIRDIYQNTRTIAEPAGALGVAGLKRYAERERLAGELLVAIDSGANVNFDRLRHIAERAEVGEQLEMLLAVTIPERAGSLLDFCRCIGERSVTEFNYRYAGKADAQIFLGLELREGAEERAATISRLVEHGYPVVDLSDDEMAKLHIRHMVGGPAAARDERLFRFEFPERPGALLGFLTHLGGRWNISLFHYRNHGSAYGRVLMGIQVPVVDYEAFDRFLEDVGYRYREETENPAYRVFLR